MYIRDRFRVLGTYLYLVFVYNVKGNRNLLIKAKEREDKNGYSKKTKQH